MTHFRTMRSLESFPRPDCASVEIRCDSSYHYLGSQRSGEPQCVFEYTLSGCGCFRDAAGEHMVRPGEGFLCQVSDPETAYYYPPEATEPWCFVYLSFRGGGVGNMVAEMVRRYGAIYPLAIDGAMIQRLLSYAPMDGLDVPLSAAEGTRLVMSLLTDLVASRQVPDEKDASGQLVRRAIDLVRRNLSRNINAAELADMLDVSREHLTRVFKRQTAQSPYQYIVHRKMLIACRLLKESDMSVKQISRAVGFEDSAHFNRSFKAAIKMTPSVFRQSGIMPGDL